jgi:hypothetical protein
MGKQFISEAQRMQKLAGIPISEMALPEMARTAGTGGAYTITEKGEEILKQTKAAGKAPDGIKNSEIAALVFLFKAKKDGKRVQKIDYAAERNVPQPAINPIFNSLEAKELVAREGYTSKQQEPKTSRPRPDINAVLGDLDIEESQKKTLSEEDEDNSNEDNIDSDFEKSPEYHSYEEVETIFKETGPEELKTFQQHFKGKKQISKKEYLDFADNVLPSEGEDWFFNMGNWISLSDPDWYSRNYFEEGQLNENEGPDLTKDEKIFLENKIEDFLNDSLFNTDMLNNDSDEFSPTKEEKAIQFVINTLKERTSYY